MSFYTRKPLNLIFGDRLQVRMSTNGTSANVGTTATDVGSFTTLLLDNNPTQDWGLYPFFWRQEVHLTVSGVPSPTIGRLAFRYFVVNGGPAGAYSENIGIDRFVYRGPCSPRQLLERPHQRPHPPPPPPRQ